jgi:signal transduction histidine kinase
MERLEANFEQMRRFTVDASHELRTPLTAVRGQLEVALMTARTPEQFRTAVENTLQDVERMGRIVKSLLDLARAESGQVGLRRAAIELPPLIDQIAAQFRMVAEEKQIRVLVETPESCRAEVDRTQFERLLSNLLSNAVQYTQDGGEVAVKLERQGEQIHLSVRDNGPGIAAVHLPRIFERFYRVREGERGSEKGLGLGLAFAVWIVKAHGGQIEVHSQLGQGTTFDIHLPAEAPVQPPQC